MVEGAGNIDKEEDRAAYIWVEEDRETGSQPPLPPLTQKEPRPGCGGSRGETKNREVLRGWSVGDTLSRPGGRPSGELGAQPDS